MNPTRRIFLMGALSLTLTAPRSAIADVVQERSALETLVKAARGQIGITTGYDPSYVRLIYPGGDVSEDRGVCTDVIIRAFRTAFGFDFQKALHEDMSAGFSGYPKIWGLKRPDRNIDHRRVPNLETWLYRGGHEVQHGSWRPGDLITCRLPGNLPHIALVAASADRKTILLRCIHNIGRGTREDSLLLTGLSGVRQFRFLPG